MVGAGLIAVARISSGRADDSYLGAMMSALARSLGLDQSRAAELVSEPVTALELDASFAARAESCASQPDEADGNVLVDRIVGSDRLRSDPRDEPRKRREAPRPVQIEP